MNSKTLFGSTIAGLILFSLVACEQSGNGHSHDVNMVDHQHGHDDHAHEEQHEKPKGPHGGWLFSQDR